MSHFPDADPVPEKVLTLLRHYFGQPVSTQLIAQELQLESPHVERAISVLRGLGYAIAGDSTGFILRKPSEQLVPAEIERGLKTRVFGKTIHCYDHLDSTNERAYQMAEDGEADGTLILADRQVKGHGRRGRSWFSPPGMGIWMSVILRPEIAPVVTPGLSLVAGLSLAEVIESELHIAAALKWPNDCLLNGKKVAGILTELSAEQNKVRFVIWGVGINVSQQLHDFPPELRETATSLALATKRPVNRVHFLREFLYRLEENYLRFIDEGLAPFIEPYARHCSIIGCDVEAQVGNKTVSGRAVRIDPRGALVLTRGETEIVLTAGEVIQVR